MLALLLESALRLLALGGIVWLVLKILRVRNPQVADDGMDGGAARLVVDAGADAFHGRDNSGRSAATAMAKLLSAAPAPSVRGDTPFGGDTPSGATGATCRGAGGLESGVTVFGSDATSDAFDWREVIAGIYLVVAGVLLLRLLIGLVLTWRLTRRGGRCRPAGPPVRTCG